MKFGSKNTIKFTQQQTLVYKNCILEDRVMKIRIHYRYIPFIKIYTVYRSQWAIKKI